MAENNKKEPKAKLDSDDILPDLGLADDKAEIDSAGLTDTPGLDDKALLDSDGILEEEIPRELEAPRQPPPEKKEEQAAQRQAESRPPGVLLERLKKLPWIKIGALGGGSLVLFCAGWLLLSLILSPEPTPDSGERDTLTASVEEGLEAQKDDGALTLELEPFVIPLADAKKKTSFMRISIVLRAQPATADELRKENTSIRSTIYNLLSHAASADIIDDERQEVLRRDLLKLLNSLLKQEMILSVNFSRILLV